MPVVGFNFKKINVERKQAKITGKINISNNIIIKSIEEKGLSLGKTKQDGLKFVFEFSSKYDPDVGSITLTGEVLYIDEKAKVDEILGGWKKSKKVPQETMTSVLNAALTKCNVEALILSQEINLPPPIPLPKIQPKESKEYIG